MWSCQDVEDTGVCAVLCYYNSKDALVVIMSGLLDLSLAFSVG